jgi:hypothetical protein
VTIGYLSTLIRTAGTRRRRPGASLSRPVEDALIARPDRLDGELDRLDGGRSREAVKFRHRELYT